MALLTRTGRLYSTHSTLCTFAVKEDGNVCSVFEVSYFGRIAFVLRY
jgi:hypothetical protein